MTKLTADQAVKVKATNGKWIYSGFFVKETSQRIIVLHECGSKRAYKKDSVQPIYPISPEEGADDT